MRKNGVATIVAVSVMGFVSGTLAESKFLAEGVAGLWYSPNLDGFEVMQGGGGEVISGDGSFIGNLKAGMEIEDSSSVLDVAAVGGVYGNGALYGYLLGGDASIRYKFSEKKGAFSMGPHFGLNYYAAPEWQGTYENAVDFEQTLGLLIGVKATFGGEKLRAVITLDYAATRFAVNPKLGTANRDHLDMNGVILQAGIQF
jgi:hypothetical protein